MTQAAGGAIMPTMFRPLPAASALGSRVIFDGGSLLGGWSFRETTGAAPAIVEIFDGHDVNGILVATISLAPSESTRDPAPGAGIELQSGLFLSVLAGTFNGSLWSCDR